MTENDVTIKESTISTIDISGVNNFYVQQKHDQAVKSATMYGGKILRDKNFSDGGYFMEVWFPTTQFKEIWENSIGVEKK